MIIFVMPQESEIRNIEGEHRGRRTSFKWPEFTFQNVFIVILFLALITVLVYVFKPGWFKGVTGKSKSAKVEQKQEVKSSGYSAVFLTNNQVYFGKLEDVNTSFPRLREVYYLRVDRALQPPPATESAQPDVSLVKLGNELHGPVDEIRFNREQILYIEDLKSDSRIVQAIEEFKSRNR